MSNSLADLVGQRTFVQLCIADISPFLPSMSYLVSPEPHNSNLSAEQPWVGSKYSVYDSDIEIQSSDGFVFQLHRSVLGVSSGGFPGFEMDTGGELVRLTERANVLEILFAFLYPKPRPNLRLLAYPLLADVAEAAAKYEVYSAVDMCNERLVKFIPQYAPAILAHAVKHDYTILISQTLPHFARAPFLPTLEQLPLNYLLPFARYRDAWHSVFKELIRYPQTKPSDTPYARNCNEYLPRSGRETGICSTCRISLYPAIIYLENITSLEKLRETLRAPKEDKDLIQMLQCCRNQTLCPHAEQLIILCSEKIDKMPPFADFLGIKL